MLRIAYLSDSEESKPNKKTAKQEFIESCKLLEANEMYINRKKAKAMFADQMKELEERKMRAINKLKELGVKIPIHIKF